MSTPLYALLVGINTYQAEFIPPLRGCRNDVELMASVLQSQLQVGADHLCLLLDDAATHEAIKRTFRDHLIERARRAHAAGESAPAFLFHFSGHGSRSIDVKGTKLAGVDETLVAHDSRVAGVLDIKDWELGSLLDELAQYSANITVILDCCHSGSGTRDVDVATRQCPPDYRPQPERPVAIAAGTRSADSAALQPLRHVLLAACSYTESAKEWKDQTAGGERHYGAFSYALAEELAKVAPQGTTYRDLQQRVIRRLTQRNVAQSPQCEGERDRLLFGGTRPPRDCWISVVGQEGDLIRIDAGGVHGLVVGSELNVYPDVTTQATRQIGPDTSAVARLRVVDRGAVSSLCQITEGVRELPLGSSVQPISFGTQLVRTLSLAQASPETRMALEQRVGQPDLCHMVRVTTDARADFSVHSGPAGNSLRDAAGHPLESPAWTNDLNRLARSIRKWAQHRNALQIENPSPQSKLRGQVTVEIALSSGTRITASGHTLEVGETPVDMDIVLTNRSAEPLFVSALAFGYDGSVALIWPQDGERIAIPAGKLQTIPNLQLSFPGSREQTVVQEAIKLFATRTPTDFELLTMNADGHHESVGTRSVTDSLPIGPLGQLLEQAAAEAGTRLIQVKAVKAEEDWTTAELIYQLVRPASEMQQSLASGQAVPVPGSTCTISAPMAFLGTLRPVVQRADSMEAESAAAVRSSEVSWAVTVQRLADQLGGEVANLPSLEIDADNFARAQITSATPLSIQPGPAERSLESAIGGAVLAIASDGELFYPVGGASSENEAITISWLPPAIGASSESIGTRSVVGAIRLIFYKLMSWDSGSLGLHRVRWIPIEKCAAEPITLGERTRRFVAGEVRQRRVNPGEIQPAHKVLVLVHGGMADVESMMAEVGPLIVQSGQAYDHVLAFAYETVMTPLQDSATQLAQALTMAGLAPAAVGRVDLVACGLGTLVARSAMEMLGAHARVGRCLLAGPPNQGTLLARSQNIARWLGTMALAKSALVPQLLPFYLAYNKFINETAAIRDLQPQSDFLKALNAAAPALQVPYTILAGVAVMTPESTRLLTRLADSILSQLFDDEHDLVCSQLSMATLRGGQFPTDRLKIHVVPADHFSYWTEPVSSQHVVDWLRAGEVPSGT